MSTRWAFCVLCVSTALVLVSCVTERRVSPLSPEPEGLVRVSPPAVDTRTRTGSELSDWIIPEGIDLEVLTYGWVEDRETATRLNHPRRFWSDQRLSWKRILDDQSDRRDRLSLLRKVYFTSPSAEEKIHAAWWLWKVYGQLGVKALGRPWLDNALALDPQNAVLRLLVLDDETFRLADPKLAKELWRRGALSLVDPADLRRARLIRQKLFLEKESLTRVGMDDYVSVFVRDQDDLWIGTWNGAVGRKSLTTGTLDCLLSPDRVSPISRMTVTPWFVYAFQDQKILRYSKITGTWREFSYPPGWTGLRITGVVPDGNLELTISYLGEGLWRWENGTWSLLDGAGAGPFLTALARDTNGAYWVGTKDRGLWRWYQGGWAKIPSASVGPTNISLIASNDTGDRWAVGTWGEGTWVLEDGRLVELGADQSYVTSAVWSGQQIVWGLVDDGLRVWSNERWLVLGSSDGVPSGGVTALTQWEGRWIWGTMGQGLATWSEYENSTVLR